MSYRRLLGAATVLLFASALVHGDDNPATQDPTPARVSAVWHKIGNLPAVDDSGMDSPIGIHNDALFILRCPSSSDQDRDQNDASMQGTLRVAIRENSPREDDTNANEPRLIWHESSDQIPNFRRDGSSTSHRLGVVTLAAADDGSNRSDVFLSRWDKNTQSSSVIELPPLPSKSFNGSMAVLDDVIYVFVGNDGYGPTGTVFSFELSSVTPELLSKSVWQNSSPLPVTGENGSTHGQLLAVHQKSGTSQALFVLTANRKSGRVSGEALQLWTLDPRQKEDADGWAKLAAPPNNVTLTDSSSLSNLGVSHLMLVDVTTEEGTHKTLSYNVVTNTWAEYGGNESTKLQSDVAEDSEVLFSAAVSWGDDRVSVRSNRSRAGISKSLWGISVRARGAHFGWQNMSVLVVYLFSMLLIGLFFMSRNSDTNDFFRGGKSIPWWAAGCSIYATMMSSLTFVALPALIYQTNWLIFLGVLSLPLALSIAAYGVMPFFRQIDATSAYEYLSLRFNMAVRLFASFLFVLFQIGRMGVVFALTALAVAAVTPLDPWQSVLIMGVLSISYSALGGIEAVVWTDTIQTVVLLVGAALCFVYIVGGVDGGLSTFISVGMADEKFKMLNLDFSSGSVMALSLWVVLLGSLAQNLSSYTADQAVVQRYMTTKNLKGTINSIWINGVITIPASILFFSIGTGLYVYYKTHPAHLDPNIQFDQIFPTFIGTELPVGIAGLIVAGIFAAAQSTVSTSMNSVATSVITDFIRPFNSSWTEAGYLRMARLLTVVVGVVGTIAGLIFISPEIRSLMEEYFKVIGMFMGALSGLFLLGITTRAANGRGALVGLVGSVVVMIVVWKQELANGYLFATIGIASCYVIGYLASLVLPSDNRDINKLTLYTMNRNPP